MMSDSDLDAVLERGAKKTAELQAQLNVADKGDMLDFRFDQGPGIQVRCVGAMFGCSRRDPELVPA